MKCISLKQPWAEMVLSGIKQSENRSRRTTYRGPIIIHASKRFDKNWRDIVPSAPALLKMRDYLRTLDIAWRAAPKWYHGHLVGVGYLTQCRLEKFSDFCQPGCWHYKIMYCERFRKPYAFKGMLGLFGFDIKRLDHTDYNTCKRLEERWKRVQKQIEEEDAKHAKV